jgi:hypothetical protein
MARYGGLFRRLLGVGLLLALAVDGRSVWAAAPSAPSVARGPLPRYPSVGFVVSCAFSHRSNDDPIVHPGHGGMSHRHDFFGNATTTATSTLVSLRRGSTTCSEAADRASYWIPSMVNTAWVPTMRAYYSAGVMSPSTITAFPEGLQLLAGNPSASRLERAGAVTFSCGRSPNEAGWTTAPAACDGPTSVRITFPQCWDGRTLGAPGNSRYPVGNACPNGFPVVLPLLRIVVSTIGRAGPTPFALSVGSIDRMHADFWNAWDPAALDELISICIRGERESNRDVKRCRVVGTGPASVGSSGKETNF